MKKIPSKPPEKIKLPPKITEQLDDIIAEKKRSVKKGLVILFSGSTGKGKTQAAQRLSTQLDLPMYRIDLSAVVSKYIGETEKNLKRVFDAAEKGGNILVFDEADALFGRRSELSDAHDRFAKSMLDRLKELGQIIILSVDKKEQVKPKHLKGIRTTVVFDPDDFGGDDPGW